MSGADGQREISLADEGRVKEVVVQSILRLWEVVNDLTRLKPTSQERYRVTIFGSARAPQGSFVYEETRRVARELTELGCDVITGGGPGLMRAANEGAREAGVTGGQKSVGILVELPFEESANAFVTEAFEHQSFFTRLHHFVLASNAFVVAPGGIGTVLEAMMIWQLLQVKHLEQTPFIMVGEMWKGLVGWARSSMLDPAMPLASPEHLELPRCVRGGAEAMELLRNDHQRWARAQEARRKERPR